MSDDRIESHEERLLVLRDKAAREGFVVGDDVLDYIADKYSSATTLKGALINVQALASRKGVPVSLSVARLALDGIRETPPPSPPDQVAADEGSWVEPTGELADEWAPQTELPELDGEVWGEPEIELGSGVQTEAAPASDPDPVAAEAGPDPTVTATLFAPPPAQAPAAPVAPAPAPTVVAEPTPVHEPAFDATREAAPKPGAEPAIVWFAPMRSTKKESLVKRAGSLLKVAGIKRAIGDGDLVAIKLHFGEEGNTGFIQPVFLREVVRQVRKCGAKPFLTDGNTLYRGKRANAVDHLNCAIHNGFSHATLNAPLIIADGLDGRDGVDVPIEGFEHFDSVRIGAAAVHADAMVVVTHFKGHEATGFGGAIKNIGMGLGTRAAKQRMHSDLKPQVAGDKCTACKRCVKSCPVDAIRIVDRVAVIDYELCYGCGECVAACPYGAIGIQWKTEPRAIQEKMVEHCAGALAGKEGKVVYLSFVTNVSPDCDCWSFSDASVVADIGVLASTDLVAIDQAAYDLVTQAEGLPGSLGEGLVAGVDKFREITGIDGTVVLEYAEAHAMGTRSYQLKVLD